MNREIQQNSDYLANWQKPANSAKYGPLNIINQLGEFTGGALPVNMSKEKLITSNLYEYAFREDANSKFFTTEKLNAMEEALGVTAQSVYDSYAAEYADVIAEKTASGELKDTYNTINGNPTFLVPTLERVAERLGLQIAPPTPDDTKIYFSIPAEWGEVKWNSKHTKAAVYCHMYRVYNGTELKSFTFATASERCEFEHDNVFSFDTTVYGDILPGADYVVILAVDNVSGVRHQTCDITMGFDCLGDTLTPTSETRTNSMDSQKQDYLAVWSKSENAERFGPMNLIDSLGNLLGGKFPYYMPRAKLIADRLYDPAFKMKTNAKYFTTQRFNELEAELGVTARQVYDQYVTTYKDLIEEGIANGTLVDKYDNDGNPEYLVPTLERVAERLGITV